MGDRGLRLEGGLRRDQRNTHHISTEANSPDGMAMVKRQQPSCTYMEVRDRMQMAAAEHMRSCDAATGSSTPVATARVVAVPLSPVAQR
jgi:hypothetical protein